MVRLLRRYLAWRSRADRVSDQWVAAYRQASYRNGFLGVSWRWPVNKRINEAAAFNTARLRKRA